MYILKVDTSNYVTGKVKKCIVYDGLHYLDSSLSVPLKNIGCLDQTVTIDKILL